MEKLSPEILKQIREAMKGPEGTAAFTYTFNDDLFDIEIPGGKIFEIVSGKHYFLVERTNNLEVKFYYSSPGTGTRVAMINLNSVIPSKKVFFCFVWSPKEIRLSIGPKDVEKTELVNATGVDSNKRFQVGEDGQVVQIGDENLEIIGQRINVGGKQVIKPTAIEAWREINKAVEILLSGESKEGFIFETVRTNLIIVIMVTGFEAYCKTRLQEIEEEGINPDFEKISKKLYLSKEEIFKPQANYFQNIEGSCREIYSYGVGIKFSILLDSNDSYKLKQLFKFRHRIVHVSPLLTQVNEFQVPKEAPIFSAKIVNESLGLFNEFINNLHKETLKLRKKD